MIPDYYYNFYYHNFIYILPSSQGLLKAAPDIWQPTREKERKYQLMGRVLPKKKEAIFAKHKLNSRIHAG